MGKSNFGLRVVTQFSWATTPPTTAYLLSMMAASKKSQRGKGLIPFITIQQKNIQGGQQE